MEIRVPQLAEGISSGTVVSILVAPGDVVSKDQTIIELETEKAVAPVPAPYAGKVSEVLVSEGQKVSVGQAVVRLAEEGAAAKPEPQKAQDAAAERAAIREEPKVVERTSVVTGAAVRKEVPGAAEHVPPPASPSLRKTARELGIDLWRVQGSGAGGRISVDDVRAYIQELQRMAFEQPAAAAAAAAPARPSRPPLPDFSKFGQITCRPVSLLRKKIAEKMSLSWGEVVHVTQFDEADLTRLNDLRRKYKQAYQEKGAKLTLTVLLTKAILNVLERHPEFSVSLDEEREEIIFKEYINLGMAVDTEQGLIVPVIRDANKKSLLELSSSIQTLAKKARERTVSLEELQGGTFTISNQGGIGGTHFTPIVNWPEAAIIGLGQSREHAVVREGKVETAALLPVALSYDHRLIDGGSAARFIADLMKEIREFTEDALRL